MNPDYQNRIKKQPKNRAHKIILEKNSEINTCGGEQQTQHEIAHMRAQHNNRNKEIKSFQNILEQENKIESRSEILGKYSRHIKVR